jgi:hypothetical protein
VETFDTVFFAVAALAALAVVIGQYRSSLYFGVVATGAVPDGSGEAEETIQTTGATLDCPVWLFGTEGAERWVFPPRRDGGLTVWIVDLSDPYTDFPGGEERGAVIDGASLVITELMWALGDLPAADVAMLVTDRRRVFTLTAEDVSFDDVAPVLEGSDADRIALAWGVADDPAAPTLRLSVRVPGAAVDLEIAGTVPVVTARLLGLLENEGRLTALDPPSWYLAPAEEDLPVYARLMDDLHLQVIADENNGFIPPLAAELHGDLVDRARSAWQERPGGGAQWAVLAAITAMYAQRANGLGDEQRRRTVEDVLAAEPGTPLARLAPHLLTVLDERGRAIWTWGRLRPGAEGSYAEWLDAIDPRATEDPG